MQAECRSTLDDWLPTHEPEISTIQANISNMFEENSRKWTFACSQELVRVMKMPDFPASARWLKEECYLYLPDQMTEIWTTRTSFADFIVRAHKPNPRFGLLRPARAPSEVAFNVKPVGDVRERFLKDMEVYDAQYDSNKHPGRVIALVNSSGVGKSYLVKLLHETDPLPRTASDEWPLQDTEVCEFLWHRMFLTYKGEELAGALLGGLFHVMAEQLETLQSLDEFNKAWPYGGERRKRSFEEVVKKASDFLVHTDWGSIRDVGKIHTPEGLDADPQNGYTSWYQAIYGAVVKPSLERLCNIRDDLMPGAFMFIALDMCCISLSAFQHIMKACESHSCWFLLLYKDPFLLPTQSLVTSHNRINPALAPYVVWPHFRPDIMILRSKRISSPSSALSTIYLAYYGRPYWWAHALSRSLIWHAHRKFISKWPYPSLENSAVFSLLSARVLLPLANNQEARFIASSSVELYGRYLDQLDSDTFRTSTPSEPILAITAACHMLSSRVPYERYNAIMHALATALVHAIDQRHKGDLIARLLLTMAHDAAIGKEGPLTNWDVTCVSLKDFFAALLPPAVAASLPVEFAKYVFNFTHFIQLTHTIHLLTAKYLFDLWCRGAAVQCAVSQSMFDILLIAYHKDHLEEPFDANRVLLVTVQVKGKPGAATSDLEIGPTVPFLFGPPTVQKGDLESPVTIPPGPSKPPHISVLMDLGSTTYFEDDQNCPHPNVKVTNGHPEFRDGPQGLDGTYSASGFPLCHIHVRGRDGDVYPVVRKLGYALLNSDLWMP
ncbi:hypothetical protein ONZ45_g19318 [Pleurotus djamor]|nr:hypothetical protein ONZ45_g19318 [Pleurotus djamor]